MKDEKRSTCNQFVSEVERRIKMILVLGKVIKVKLDGLRKGGRY